MNQVDGVVAPVTRAASFGDGCQYCGWLPCVSQGGGAGITQRSLEVAAPVPRWAEMYGTQCRGGNMAAQQE